MTDRGRDAGPAVIAVACPHCRAQPRQRCTSSYGGPTATHAARKRAAQAEPAPTASA